jgi:hypothetical protein
MTSAVWMRPMTHASPLLKARLAGFFWLLTIAAGVYAMIVDGGIVVAGNAAATAANLADHEMLFRSGTAAILMSTASYIVATLLVYELLKPVSRTVSLLAAFFSLVGCAVGAIACAFDVAPFVLLAGTRHLSAFTPEQLQSLALASLSVRLQANDIGLVFFGLHCLLVGCLILKSTFLPRLLGGLMVIAGLGWLTFLFPPLAKSLNPYIMMPGGIGEAALTLWLIVFGINVQRWQEQKRNAQASAT